MKNIIILLLLFFTSCEIEYDGETKLVVKGTLKNENNQEIINQNIKLMVTRNASYLPFVFYYPSETNFIGMASTDSNGKFTIVIPKPKNNFDEIIVEINDESNLLNAKRIVNIQTDNFMNYELNLGELKLFNKTNLCRLQIVPNQINPENELLELSYIGDIANELFFYNLPENYSYFYDLEKNVAKNQTIILNYKTKNYLTNIVSSQQISIIIGDLNEVDFTLNY